MDKINKLFVSLFSICFGLLSCNEQNNYVVIDTPVALLEKPYPLNYPSTNPEQNKIITMLSIGKKLKIINVFYGKDYLSYEVLLKKGKTGFIIHSKSFRIVADNE